MFKNKILLVGLIILAKTSCLSQTNNLVVGRITSKNMALPAIQVMNLVTEKSTVSDSLGNFSIAAKEDEMIVFISSNYEYKRLFIEKENTNGKINLIELEPKVNQLKEVVVNANPMITAADLGIVPKNQKTYSPAERKLKAAGEFKPNVLLGLVSGIAMPVDPILNAISGRTTQLKNELAVERKEISLEKISNLFSNEYYVKSLKIEENQIKSFQYFLLDDKEFMATLKTKNKSVLKFIMTKLAVNFKKALRDEKSN